MLSGTTGGEAPISATVPSDRKMKRRKGLESSRGRVRGGKKEAVRGGSIFVFKCIQGKVSSKYGTIAEGKERGGLLLENSMRARQQQNSGSRANAGKQWESN